MVNSGRVWVFFVGYYALCVFGLVASLNTELCIHREHWIMYTSWTLNYVYVVRFLVGLLFYTVGIELLVSSLDRENTQEGAKRGRGWWRGGVGGGGGGCIQLLYSNRSKLPPSCPSLGYNLRGWLGVKFKKKKKKKKFDSTHLTNAAILKQLYSVFKTFFFSFRGNNM